MSGKKTHRNNSGPATSARSTGLWIVAAVAVVLIGGGLTLLLSAGSSPPENGTPELVVDQPVIDEGYQKLDQVVRTSFTLRNEGDAALRILGEPQVKLVEGC